MLDSPPILLDKPVGLSPLQAIDRLRQTRPELRNATLAYAGRLDPMASGLLIILKDEQCRNRDSYQQLDKTYRFEMLLGMATDTYDVLGRITQWKLPVASKATDTVVEAMTSRVGSFFQTYPPYSAARVQGKPLYYWARRGEMPAGPLPGKTVSISRLELVDSRQVTASVLYERIIADITTVTGDFRQDAIKAEWQERIGSADAVLQTLTFEVDCSSGLYVRSLVHDVGQSTGYGAVTLGIYRTRVGPYTIHQALKLSHDQSPDG